MWEICVNTPLGESLILTGQEITLEVMDKKPEMLAALEPCQSDQAAAKVTFQQLYEAVAKVSCQAALEEYQLDEVAS